MPCGAIRITAACATALAAGIAAPPAAAALDFGPCPGSRGTTCAALAVPLDRTGATPGTLALRVQRLPAAGARRATLVLVPDGPGQSAAATVPTARLVRQAARGHEIVILEPRGSGAGAFTCPDLAPALAGGLRPAAARARVAACAAALGPARAFAGSGATAGDLEQLRGELGVERLVLAGTGYGSVAALPTRARIPIAWPG